MCLEFDFAVSLKVSLPYFLDNLENEILIGKYETLKRNKKIGLREVLR